MAFITLGKGYWLSGWKVWVLVVLALIPPLCLISLPLGWLWWKRSREEYQNRILSIRERPTVLFLYHLGGVIQATWDIIRATGQAIRGWFR
jgi:hypothetical protein